MKTYAGDAGYESGPEVRISETDDLNGQSKDLDEADMIRMGKMQQTRVTATCHGQSEKFC
jgi:hypothetical protein